MLNYADTKISLSMIESKDKYPKLAFNIFESPKVILFNSFNLSDTENIDKYTAFDFTIS